MKAQIRNGTFRAEKTASVWIQHTTGEGSVLCNEIWTEWTWSKALYATLLKSLLCQRSLLPMKSVRLKPQRLPLVYLLQEFKHLLPVQWKSQFFITQSYLPLHFGRQGNNCKFSCRSCPLNALYSWHLLALIFLWRLLVNISGAWI